MKNNKGRCALFLVAFSSGMRGSEMKWEEPGSGFLPGHFLAAPAIPGGVLASRARFRFAGCQEFTSRAWSCNARCPGAGRNHNEEDRQ
jgi:hypothetical protein